MIKKASRILYASMVISLFSCSTNTLEELYQERTASYLGDWDVFRETSIFENDSFTTVITREFQLEISEDLFIENSPFFPEPDTSTWGLALNPERIFLEESVLVEINVHKLLSILDKSPNAFEAYEETYTRDFEGNQLRYESTWFCTRQ